MTSIQLLILITLILFGVKIVKDTMSLLWLIQVKEYRIDRIRSHWRDTSSMNLSDMAVALGVFVLLSVLFPATGRTIIVFMVLLMGSVAPLIFLYSTLELIFGIKKQAVKRPKPTTKMMLVAVLSFFMFAAFAYGLTIWLMRSVDIVYTIDFFITLAFYLLILVILIPLFLFAAILVVTPIADRKKKKIKEQAERKMASMKKVKTIGIAGSYGKTSTKEFLFTILGAKYKVVKTKGNNNSDMGVASTILRDVDDGQDYFISEMGAYRIGEIKRTAEIAKPFAGIITGLNEQHLDLFGSIQNTKRAKFELMDSLPKEGFAVVNKQADEMEPSIPYKARDIMFFSEDMAENVKVHPESLEFTYKSVVFKANMLGRHYIANLLSAIMTAEKLGMTLEEIRDAVGGIDMSSEYLLQKKEGIKGAIFIDDSYSANPDGVIAALEYLEEAYPEKKRMIVFPGIIELGKDSKEIHRKIWKKTDDICHSAFILQKEDEEIRKDYQKCSFVFEKDFDKMTEEVLKRIDADTVVLFESRGAGVVMKKLSGYNMTNDA